LLFQSPKKENLIKKQICDSESRN